MSSLKKSLFIVLFVSVLISCAREKTCKLGGLNIAITNLTLSENDTLTFERYKKNGAFDELLGSYQFTVSDTANLYPALVGNTLFLSGQDEQFNAPETANTGYLSAYYDYRVITKNHVYEFKSLETKKNTKKCGGIFSLECPDCYSPVLYFIVNGEKIGIEWFDFHYLEN